MARNGLSKSRLVAWRQCPKRLWLQHHRGELLATSQDAERRFQIGYEVGEIAQSLCPNGILIEDNDNLSAAISSTKAAMACHPDRPIFEATFQHDGVLVRADLLLPAPSGYRMAEVKSSASVKPYHLDDCAIQAWVLKQNDVELCAVELAHINTAFVYRGDGHYQGLFHHERLDEVIAPLVKAVPDWVQSARSTLTGEEPDIAPGPQCSDPFECPFHAYCTRDLVEPESLDFSLDVLYRMHESSKEALRDKGYEDACKVPTEFLNDTQRWIQRVSQTGKAELSPRAAQALEVLPYPRYFLDFETINLAVPRWADTSPYRTQVPFQWSCHIEASIGELQHEMYLDVSGNDPRRACADRMIAVMGNDGPVFVYYQAFEKGRIAELAELFPDLAPDLLAINDRIVDLLPIARDNYYHPDMKGSWSIKAVLPTIASDLDYTKLTVGSGGDAQEAYREILHPDTPEERKQELTEGLRAYCKLDTLAMVRLAWFFQGLPVYLYCSSASQHQSELSSSDSIAGNADATFPAAIEALQHHCSSTQSTLIVGPVSLLQRKLRIGYSSALALLDALEARGVLTDQTIKTR